MTSGDLTAEKEKIFSLIVLAERHHASVDAALTALKAERDAWAQEREAFRRELKLWTIEVRKAVHSAVQIELASATEKSVAAAQSAMAPVVAQMGRVAEQATAAEKAVVGITKWFDGQTVRWIKRLVPAGLAIGWVAMLLAWTLSGWRMQSDARAIAELQERKQQAAIELTAAQDDVAAWKQRAPKIQPVPCGPSREYWCVPVFPQPLPPAWGVAENWRALNEGRSK